ncbi:hypothetical protein RJT34_06161 [Clitoria ternatea]|uniref:RNase H type-1 domain-containing protein n=1 Tax=Clitoria ternatea TaxID=43366 RepID=A0AAN9K3W8_CLITE
MLFLENGSIENWRCYLLKFNVDGSARGQPGVAGIRGVLGNHKGDILGIFSKHVGNLWAYEAEDLFGISHKAKDKGMKYVSFAVALACSESNKSILYLSSSQSLPTTVITFFPLQLHVLFLFLLCINSLVEFISHNTHQRYTTNINVTTATWILFLFVGIEDSV